MESLVRLGIDDAGEVLTLQRAAYVTEAQAHADLDLPPLRQSLAEVVAELADPQVLSLGWRMTTGDSSLRYVLAPQETPRRWRSSAGSPLSLTDRDNG